MELMQASRQWATRPDDQRFTSLTALHAHVAEQRNHSRAAVVSSRHIEARPAQGDETKGLEIFGPNGHGYRPTNYSFGQLAAQNTKVDDLADFLDNRRFTKPTVRKIEAAFEADEGREMQTIWDVTTGITAYARQIPYQDERIALEREAGKLLDLVEA